MFVFLGTIMLAAAPAPAAAPVPPIIVIGQRLRIAEDALRDCLARHCPPNEDIDATLALAEPQLLDGKYDKARHTLLAALGRNKDEARRYPIPVSDLYRANGRVAAHMGLDWDYQYSTWSIYRTLKYGLPSEDVRKFSALMEVAEMIYRTRGHERARGYYEMVADQARAAGRPDIAALAELRSAIRHLPPNSSWQVNEIKRIAALQGADMRAPVLEAKLALARMAFLKGDEAGGQAIQRELAALNVQRPILLYSPPYELGGRDTNTADQRFGMINDPTMTIRVGPTADTEGDIGRARPGIARAGTMAAHGRQSFATHRETPVVEDMWVDIAFRITADGRVADAEIVRHHGGTFWAQPLLASLMGRRYTLADPTSPASRRLERYTYTAGFERKTDSRNPGRSPETRVEYLDLSDMGSGLTETQ